MCCTERRWMGHRSGYLLPAFWTLLWVPLWRLLKSLLQRSGRRSTGPLHGWSISPMLTSFTQQLVVRDMRDSFWDDTWPCAQSILYHLVFVLLPWHSVHSPTWQSFSIWAWLWSFWMARGWRTCWLISPGVTYTFETFSLDIEQVSLTRVDRHWLQASTI